MKVDDYRLLVTLSETGTLRKAAEKLFISQPAISQRLKTIENEWNVQIFVRTKKSLFITPSGEKIINHAREMIEKENLLKESLKTSKGRVKGNLSIGVSSLIGHTLIPKVLNEYTKRYPNVNIKIKVRSSGQLVQESNHYHLSIVRGSQIIRKTNEVILKEPHYLVSPKVNNIEELPVIEFQADPMYLKEVESYFLKRFQRRYEVQIKADQIATCKALLKSGVGMTVLPEIAIQDFDEASFTIEPTNTYHEILRETYLAYEKSVLELPQVEAFIKVLKEFI